MLGHNFLNFLKYEKVLFTISDTEFAATASLCAIRKTH